MGEARARWTLGPKSGEQRAYVQVGSARTVPRFTVTAHATAGPAAKASILGSGKNEGTVGQLLRPVVEIQVLDRNGNPVPGVPVRLETTSGSLNDSVVSTDSAGRARLSWVLGHTAGVQRLKATVGGIDRPLEIAARAKAAKAANLGFVTPKPGMALRAVQSLDVDLTDAYGNPVPDQPVVFSTKFGSVNPARVMTDVHGRAHTRWTPASKEGRRTLLAGVKGTDARSTFVLEPPEPAVKPKAALPAKKEKKGR